MLALFSAHFRSSHSLGQFLFFFFFLNEAFLISRDDDIYKVLRKTVKSFNSLCVYQYFLSNIQFWYSKWINALTIKIFRVSLPLKLPLEHFVLHSISFHGSWGSIGLLVSWSNANYIFGDLGVISDSTLESLVVFFLVSEKTQWNAGTGLLLFLHSPHLSCFSFPKGSAVSSVPHSSIYLFLPFVHLKVKRKA